MLIYHNQGLIQVFVLGRKIFIDHIVQGMHTDNTVPNFWRGVCGIPGAHPGFSGGGCSTTYSIFFSSANYSFE